MKKEASLSVHGMFVIGVLIIQYLLGMYTNMFIHFPDNISGGQAWQFAWQQLPLALHIIIGFLLLFGSLSLVVRAIRQKNRNWLIASVIGTVAMFVASASGASFIPTQTDIYSYVMAVSFIVALGAFGWGVYKEK